MNYFRSFRLLLSLLILASNFGWAAVYEIDTAHSEVGFKIRHLVSKTRGRFDSFSGTVDFDHKKMSKVKVDVKIETGSINTNNEKRDAHLKNADFFNVEKYPEMTFKSRKSKKTGKNTFQVTGDLTILGVTKPVTLDVEYLGETADPWGKTRNGFTATGTLDRKDWGMEYNIADKGGVVIGDEVQILIEIEGIKTE